jgi:very-short-patch-repair endonuclease
MQTGLKRFTEKHLQQLKKAGKIVAYAIGAKGKSTPKLPRQEAPAVSYMHWQLNAWCIKYKHQLKKEHQFSDKRKFTFDFAIMDLKVAIEYEGLNSNKSGHTTIVGYTKDTVKYNLAQSEGWTVLRFTVMNYKTLIKTLEDYVSENVSGQSPT